jgi:hypothetical protein
MPRHKWNPNNRTISGAHHRSKRNLEAKAMQHQQQTHEPTPVPKSDSPPATLHSRLDKLWRAMDSVLGLEGGYFNGRHWTGAHPTT